MTKLQSPCSLLVSNPWFSYLGPAWFLTLAFSLDQELCELRLMSVWVTAGAPGPGILPASP